MAQSSQPANFLPDATSHSAIIGDPASGTVDVDAGEKVSTVGRVAACLERLDSVDLLRGLLMVIIVLVFDLARYKRIVFDTIFATGTPPPGYGYSLPFVYLVRLGVVLAFYPVCR